MIFLSQRIYLFIFLLLLFFKNIFLLNVIVIIPSLGRVVVHGQEYSVWQKCTLRACRLNVGLRNTSAFDHRICSVKTKERTYFCSILHLFSYSNQL